MVLGSQCGAVFISTFWPIYHFENVPRFQGNLCTPDIKDKVCPILKWRHEIGSNFSQNYL
jgi:hypothetical protein